MKKILAKTLTLLMTAVLVLSIFTSLDTGSIRADISYNATVVNVNNNVNVRSAPTNTSTAVGIIDLCERVYVESTCMADSSDLSGFSTWCKIQFMSNGNVKQGYIPLYYINRDSTGTGASDAAFESAIASFPESYKPYLRDLHNQHPSWNFVPVYTGVSWDSAIALETLQNVSLISNSSNGSWKSKASYSYDSSTGNYYVIDASNWVNASAEIVAYYMDPRNSLNETGIFQFMDLVYTADNSIPASSVTGVTSGTFLNANVLDQNSVERSYADIFAEAGNISDVNPIFLAAHVVQECSKNGSTSSNGSTGYYNLYNIGAYSSIISASVLGLEFAQNGLSDETFNSTYLIPWDTPGKSVVGGAKWIYDNYVGQGQSTLYFMRFNFDPASATDDGKHQYMTSTASALTESARMQTAYIKAGLYDTAITFKIPVYDSMPGSACSVPEPEVAPPITTTASTSEFVSTGDKIADFVIFLYRSTLDRSPDAVGYDYWYKKITVEGMSGENVAYGFVFSQEMDGKNLSNEEYIKILYRAFLGREYDVDGLNYWIDKMANGGYSKLDVYYGFSRSTEFINKCVDAGFKPYNGYTG